MADERSPLLQFPASSAQSTHAIGDHHSQFCHLIGTRPINLPPDQRHSPHPESLYSRAVAQKKSQNRTYLFTATLTNTLILSQVVLGAALTGLGASNSSHILVTIFGAFNTIIAGLIAWLKSRGQPMRARMFRDDLERVVDEIENSAMMWLGISKNVHGYDKIDTDDQVTVRSEVARLTRLYDRAVKTNTLNDPDMYSTGAPTDPHNAALRGSRAGAGGQAGLPPPPPAPPAVPAVSVVPVSGPPPPQEAVVAPVAAQDSDASPATKEPVPEPEPESAKDTTDKPAPAEESKDKAKAKDEEKAKDSKAVEPAAKSKPGAADGSSSKPNESPSANASEGKASAGASAATASDPDESPATAAVVRKHTEDTSTNEEQK